MKVGYRTKNIRLRQADEPPVIDMHQTDGIYKTKVKIHFFSLLPSLIIDESYLQTFLHSLLVLFRFYLTSVSL